MAHLHAITARRGEALAAQVSELVRSNAAFIVSGVRDELTAQMSELQAELQAWVGANKNLRAYSDGHIGWLLREQSEAATADLDCTARFQQLYALLSASKQPQQPPPLSASDLELLPLPEDVAPLATNALERWQSLHLLLVPGLLTKWYPMYMSSLRSDLARLGLPHSFSAIDTDASVLTNAARLAREIREVGFGTGHRSGGGGGGRQRRVVLLCHSKGGVDAAAALSLNPDIQEHVAALVTMQSPHSGSAIAQDLAHTDVQHRVAVAAIQSLLGGNPDAVLDLSYAARQEFHRHCPSFPTEGVRTLCVACCERRPNSSLLSPTIQYTALRYGELSDGCVCQRDALLPGVQFVNIEDMDHFGPAWRSFPATDAYDPTRLWLACASIALSEGGRIATRAAKHEPFAALHPAAEAEGMRSRTSSLMRRCSSEGSLMQHAIGGRAGG